MSHVAVKARDLIFDVLGDFVQFGGGEVRLKALVTLGDQLGVSSANMRVLVARMREQGWLAVRREGRESIYSLTFKTLRTLDEGRQRIFRAEPAPWSGSWSMVIYTVPESDRPRASSSSRPLLAGVRSARAGDLGVAPPLLSRVADIGATLPNAKLELLEMQASDTAADRSIAERCWELEALNEEYAEFIRDLRLRLPTFRYNLHDPAEAFRASIELVHAYRQFPTRDPGLACRPSAARVARRARPRTIPRGPPAAGADRAELLRERRRRAAEPASNRASAVGP